MNTDKDELRIKVAELCPGVIRLLELKGDDLPSNYAPSRWQYYAHNMWRDCILNDPLADLNACREFRRIMKFSQRQEFVKNLRKITAPNPRYELADSELIWATAEQRCRAFVLCHSQKESQ